MAAYQIEAVHVFEHRSLGHKPIIRVSQNPRAVIHCQKTKEAGMARFDLTDFERSVIQPLLPTKVRGISGG